MKITQSQLRQIIKEELARRIAEDRSQDEFAAIRGAIAESFNDYFSDPDSQERYLQGLTNAMDRGIRRPGDDPDGYALEHGENTEGTTAAAEAFAQWMINLLTAALEQVRTEVQHVPERQSSPEAGRY